MPSLLIDQIQRHALAQPDAQAAMQCSSRDGGPSISWRQFRNAIGCFAQQLRTMLPAGATILLISPSSIRYLVAFHACLAADLSVFPISIHSSERERIEAARRAGAVACIGDVALTNCLAGLGLSTIPLDAVPLDGEDDAAANSLGRCAATGSMLLQSSGTTGLPKIVRRSLAALEAVGENCRLAVGVTPKDRMLAAVPISHSYGIDHVVLAAPLAGCAVVLCDGFDAKHVDRILAMQRITIFPAVPFIFESLAQAASVAHRLPDLRQPFSAGSPLSQRVFDAFLHAFGVPIGQLYGSTEFGSVTFNDPAITPFTPLSVGRPMPGVQMRILDRDNPHWNAPLPVNAEGHVAVMAPSMFSEYIGSSESSLADGVMLPGDLGRIDSQGRLAITGRTKLLIDVGGLKVNPLEVEATLAEHPSVREVIVLALPMSDTVQRVKAVIVWRDGKGDVEDLRRFARQHLAPYKVPRVYEERDVLPRSATGKVLRSALQST